MTYEVKWTGKFKKSYKLAKKRGLDVQLLSRSLSKKLGFLLLYEG